MLPLSSKIAFLVFAAVTGSLGAWGFYRLYRRIARGRTDTELRFDGLAGRLGAALVTTLTQSRTFRKRPIVGLFHSCIFYGFVFYVLVNLVDAVEGFFPVSIQPENMLLSSYIFLADIFSFLVLLGVVALVVRRFLLPARRDFRFNKRTSLHENVKLGRISRDSLIVSTFILFHVGSRALGAAARVALEGKDKFEPFASLLSGFVPVAHAEALRVFGFWGALGSVLAFLAYFPYTKHVHIFMAPLKYVVARRSGSGVMPPVELNLEAEGELGVGAKMLEDLAWPRMLDAYACIQCNRCQDVCPASSTGKSLSPAALEINKRMELNSLGALFELGGASPRPLLQFALSPEAAWACTTCGACVEVCPVGDEQMFDILDVRRQQVMIEGEFPAQLQTAFRGMERAQNPWGINKAKRLDWAEGLNVPTTEEKPEPDVLYWVGCAASYDPSAQKTARAFVQLLDHAGVDFAVLGKRECCTGDSARRAGNEVLYRQLADENVATLNEVKPKLIVASCPHCMNAIGKEYGQIGGDYKVVHHTEYLEGLVSTGKLSASPSGETVTYHDPCYLGRHNGVYDAPRNLLHILSNDVVELPRAKENSFCCGAGGAQFWKEEEEGDERISDNRFREAQGALASAEGGKVLAVGCPFCKSMLGSTPLKGAAEDVTIKDVAEILLEGVLRAKGGLTPVVASDVDREAETILLAQAVAASSAATPVGAVLADTPVILLEEAPSPVETLAESAPAPVAERRKWAPRAVVPEITVPAAEPEVVTPAPERKKWKPKESVVAEAVPSAPVEAVAEPVVERKKWQPRAAVEAPTAEPVVDAPAPPRKKWSPKKVDEA